jgi:hypothetical protein
MAICLQFGYDAQRMWVRRTESRVVVFYNCAVKVEVDGHWDKLFIKVQFFSL